MAGLVFGDVIDVERLAHLQRSFADATELGVICVDASGRPKTEASRFTAFCRRMRADPELGKLCRLCDAHGSCQAAINGRPYVYRCHAGLLDLSVALFVNDLYVGGVLCGQTILADRSTLPVSLVAEDERWRSNAELRRLVDDIPRVSSRKVKGVADALFELAREVAPPLKGLRVLAPRGTPPTASPREASAPATGLAAAEARAVTRACVAGNLPAAQDAATAAFDRIWREPSAPQRAAAVRLLLQHLAVLVGEFCPEHSPAASRLVVEALSTPGAGRRWAAQSAAEALADLVVSAREPSGQVEQLLNHVVRDLSRDVNLDEAARRLSVHPSTLSRLVKRTLGTSYTQWRTARRIGRAKLLLGYTSASVAEVAQQVGFSSVGYLARCFRQETGMTPHAWRRVARTALSALAPAADV